MRRLLLPVFAGGLALTACAGDDTEAADEEVTTTSAVEETTTTTTEARPVDSTFVTDDVEGLCADLDGLSDIDPGDDPTQAQVDRLLAIAETAPPGVAGPLEAVAAVGQLAVDASADPDAVPDNAEEIQNAAVEGATLLIAYGNEACAIDVPLFDAIAGV